MDIADKAQAAEERFVDDAIKSALHGTVMQMDGYCHFCDEPAVQLFCCIECRDDYDKEQRLIKQAGKKN